MKTSCISHPANNPSLKIHAWQLKAVKENLCAAALLSYFESILNHDSSIQDFQQKFDGRAERAASLISESGIPCKLSALRQEIMSFWGEKKISESLYLLEQIGFISLLDATDPFKRTKYIRFYPEACNKWIRANYNDMGNYLATQNESYDSTKKAARFNEKASLKRLKGISTKNEQIDPNSSSKNSQKNSGDFLEPRTSSCQNEIQASDLPDNAKMPYRESSKGLSEKLKGVLNINQLTNSINLNQDDLSNNSLLKNRVEERGADMKNKMEHPIVKALMAAGLAADKFKYPDVLTSIFQLEGEGATPDMFIKAYDKAMHVTNGKGFGVKYINKIVEGDLHKEKKAISLKSRSYSYPQKTKKSKDYNYEHDLSNAMQWAVPYLDPKHGKN